MTQPSWATEDQSFNPLPDGGGSSAGMSQHIPLATPVPAVAEAVDRALASARHKTEQDLPGGETSVRRDSLPDHTRSRNPDIPVMDFLPPVATSRPHMATFHALQEWEGYVVDIEDGTFVARLVDLTAGHSHESEEAIIPMAEVSEYDASRMVVGSIFRWVLGYERSPEGTRKRVSQIVFRDLPKMTTGDFSDGREWARKVASALSP